ncbi:hypothetical protein QW131_07215 [Roseibium salinum]|nr:hypothetical protein [Roseibium salinum]
MFAGRLARCLSVLILVSLVLGPSFAGAEEWVVKRVSGIAYFVAPGVEAYRVEKGMVFEKKGFTMGTRPGARALIARGDETIAVGPNTTFAISKRLSRGTRTTLLQRKGTIEVDVEKAAAPAFLPSKPRFFRGRGQGNPV